MLKGHNNRPGVDAGWRVRFASPHYRPRATQAGCWETALCPGRRPFDVERKTDSCHSRGDIRKSSVRRSRLHGLAPVLFLLSLIKASALVLYVDVNSASPTPPYTNWATAAANILDAVDAASAGDKIWVNDGLYQTGGSVLFGSMTNRVTVTKPVEVQSVNGPLMTIIRGAQIPYYLTGDGAVRCAYLTNGAALLGFTLTNGATRASGDNVLEQCGGGVWCEPGAVLSNCVVSGNSASRTGGGVFQGIINDSL